MPGRIERWYPVLLGLLIASCYYWFLQSHPLPNSLKELFGAATTLSGIAIGFLATAESILFSINHTYVVRQLKSTNTYKKLINYFMDAIQWSFVLAIFSFIGLFINFTNQQYWHSLAFSLWVFFLVTAGLSAYRVIDIFASVLRSSN